MAKPKIDRFTEKHFFLSTYYPSRLMFDGLPYFNSEAAFQAQKTEDERVRLYFTDLPPNEAKAKGRGIKPRDGWDSMKDDIMYRVCKAKFEQNPKLKKWLLETGDAYLENGNSWRDYYWGVCENVGRNKLGNILMKVREELKNGD